MFSAMSVRPRSRRSPSSEEKNSASLAYTGDQITAAAYRHFDDKADLLSALALETLLDLAAAIRQGAGTRTRGTRLHRGCRGYLRYALEKPHHYLLIFGDAPISEPSRDLETAADDGMRALRELVESAQAAGEIVEGPSRELATILWALLHGLAQLHLTGHLSEPRTIEGDAGIERLVTLALDTFRPAPS
jgi:AcrR family transcriptional regulator